MLIIYFLAYLNFIFIEEKYRMIAIPNLSKFKSLFVMIFIYFMLSFISLNSNGFQFRHSDLNSFSEKNPNLEFIAGTNYLIQDGTQCLNRSAIEQFCNYGFGKKNIYSW